MRPKPGTRDFLNEFETMPPTVIAGSIAWEHSIWVVSGRGPDNCVRYCRRILLRATTYLPGRSPSRVFGSADHPPDRPWPNLNPDGTAGLDDATLTTSKLLRHCAPRPHLLVTALRTTERRM
jgi:hypothetical protein